MSERIRLTGEANSSVKELFDKEYENDLIILSERWKTEKMSMVPGNRLLDAIFSEFGMRYNTTQIDSDLLYQSLQRLQWPKELTDVLEKVVKIASDAGNSIFEA